MKPFLRKLGEPIPVALLVQPDGTLVLADGGDVKTYLAEARALNESVGHVDPGEPLEVTLSPRRLLERIERDAWMHMNHSA